MTNIILNAFYGLGIVLLLVWIFWEIKRMFYKSRNIHIRNASLTIEELEELARTMSLQHSVSSNKNILNWPVSRMNDNARFIRQVYEELSHDVIEKRTLPTAAEWLLDNYYVIEEQVFSLRKDVSKKSYFRLPVLKKGPYKGYTRVYALAMEMVSHTHGKFDDQTLVKYLMAYQSHNVLFEREIYSIPAMLRIALIENIRGICEDILETKKQWALADETVEKWLEESDIEDDKIQTLFKNNSKSMVDALEQANRSYIEHLFFRLRRSGKSFSSVLHYIDAKLDKLNTTAEILASKAHNAQAMSTIAIGNSLVSLKLLSSMTWTELFDEVSSLEKILCEDPLGFYHQMDIQTRYYYKNQIEEIAQKFRVSELYIANQALNLAKEAMLKLNQTPQDKNLSERLCHIGYYIVDQGRQTLELHQQNQISLVSKSTQFLNVHQGFIYMLSIIVLTLLSTLNVVMYAMSHASIFLISLTLLIGLIVLIPISEIVVSFINWLVLRLKKPTIFPRLDMKQGIPQSMSTMVVIPTLLSDKKRIHSLMENMENHYLGNKETNVYFALIGAFKDSKHEFNPEDEEVILLASKCIKELNHKYAQGEKDIFYFYNRQRTYNQIDDSWTGWERKRGALMELNELLLGQSNTTFSYMSNPILPDECIKYVITLDADTVLPLGMIKKMIGTMAHPLNRPVIDQEKGIVVQGYGLIQPRVSFDSDSSNKSIFSRIYTGQEGLDPYASAISDVYQDLFSEGIFTGKGIYDLKVFQKVLKGKFPENAILSHDLLEGSFVRTALVSDLELIDAYPSKLNSYMARLHRWIRGDWQLVPWLLKGIYTKKNILIQNPLSTVSKWKIMDNLRRSLLTPSILLMIGLGFSVLPGSSIFWIGLGLTSLGFSFLLSLLTHLFNTGILVYTIKRHIPGFFGIKASIFQFLLGIVFLPYQAYKALDAIFVTLVRVFITKRNMLEWVTSSDLDHSQSNSLMSYIKSMGFSALIGVGITALGIYFRPESMIISITLMFVWGFSPIIAYLISKDDVSKLKRLEAHELLQLRVIGRKTWRYFEEFSDLKNNFLAPDNYQQDPYIGVAHKTSPTNIGLGLMASLSAKDMGYIGLIELKDQISRTMTTIEVLESWNGHLYNWYDTVTLQPLTPKYVSTVDSGNLVCYLIALVEGLKQIYDLPVWDETLIKGLNDTLLAGLENHDLALDYVKTGVLNPNDWMQSHQTLKKHIQELSEIPSLQNKWKKKIINMGSSFQNEIHTLIPWIEMPCLYPNNDFDDSINQKIMELNILLITPVSLKKLPDLGRNIKVSCESLIMHFSDGSITTSEHEVMLLKELKNAAQSSLDYATQFIESLNQLIFRIDTFSMNTQFSFLYNPKRDLFYIGYDLTTNTMTNSYYDLLASEARQASYIAIARGEVPPRHWFMLGRSLTVVNHYKGLVSWSGTMFEYLMPLLLMRSYKNTLLDETYSFVLKSQMSYAKQRNMPWGTSESAYHALDINLNYQYKAVGVPWLGLKRGLVEDAVVAPYATFLALMVNPTLAFQNIEVLRSEGLEGDYGYFEAADYTSSRQDAHSKKIIIKSYMAHHQGMSLMAINNVINENTMQHRFASDPHVKAARLLLQEKVPLNVIFTKDSKEKIPTSKAHAQIDQGPYRRFTHLDYQLPRAHVLSNGIYYVILTDKGTGYSKTRNESITRWRDDPITDTIGTFFYIENMNENQTWSTTHAPLSKTADEYEVVFTADKASYKRLDGNIETLSEIVVASGDNVEVRRIQFKNNGKTSTTLQVTSYFEVVAASQSSDIAHPAFSNLFVTTQYEPKYKALLANRRKRSQSDVSRWVANMIVVNDGHSMNVEYESDRAQFIGRGHTPSNPEVIEQKKPLSNTIGSVLDPILSLRTKVNVEVDQTTRLFYVSMVADSQEALMVLIEKYSNIDVCDTSFWLALTRSQVEAKYLNIKAKNLELYQNMISDILFLSPSRKKYENIIKENKLGQSSLWPYAISGDRPIVLLKLDTMDDVSLLFEVLKVHEYWRLKNLNVDLVIISNEEYSYHNPLLSFITNIVYSSQTQDGMNRHQDVFVLSSSNITIENIQLFHACAKIILDGKAGSMHAQYQESLKQETLSSIESVSSIHSEVNQVQDVHIVEHSILSAQYNEHLDLAFHNGYGGFGNQGKSYFIQLDYALVTPAPWSNVIANPNFGFLVTESGGGYTWCENSRENKITKWTNDAISDTPSEVFYISDQEGLSWSMTPLPIRESELYLIEHGFGYTTFEHRSHGLEQSLTQYVPLNESVKISKISLRNESKEDKELKITYYMTPILGVNASETKQHIVSTYSHDNILMIENPYNKEFDGKVCFIDTSYNNKTFTTDKREFFGEGTLASPDALKNIELSNACGIGYEPCGVMQVNVTLKAHEMCEIIFVMGMADNQMEASRLAYTYKSLEKAKETLNEVKAFWSEKLSVIKVNTPDSSMNLMLNGWLQYQVISCRMWARSAFYQAGGAFGFRDQLQDSLSLLNTWPALTRAQIIKHANHQFEEGDVLHWWHEPAGKGTRTQISDDYLWLAYVCAQYIHTTGDYEILNEQAHYLIEEPLKQFEEERYTQPRVSDQKHSIYDHCIRAIDNGLRLGEHGLALIRGGDWNDGMNRVGIEGKGESVWLSWFLVNTISKMIPLCIVMGDDEKANEYSHFASTLTQSIQKHGWDGEWYRRGYFDDGTPLGSSNSAECKIDSLAQSWSVISKSSDTDRSIKAMKSVENYLVKKEDGIIKLLTPPFSDGDLDPGYIKGYLPGVRENGGQYSHAAAWVVVAYSMLKQGYKAWEYFHLLNPINHTRTLRESWIYKVEPYVMAADVYGEHPHVGRGGWSWYTGAASWMFKAGLEHILGFQREKNLLSIDPTIPNSWSTFDLVYKYQDTRYTIIVHNPENIEQGVIRIVVDEVVLDRLQIHLVNDRVDHQVDVWMGEN
jgi:cyclic beta-1,2-glucan synthetase